MNTTEPVFSRSRKRLAAAVATAAMAGVIGFGAVATGTAPVLAEAVTVTAPQAPSFADVVEKVSPAVVSVQVKTKFQPAANDDGDFSFRGPDGQGFDDLPDNHPMKKFFREFRGEQFGNRDGERRFGNRERNGRERPGREGRERMRPTSQGSGFFISEDGYLVTNNHVVDGGGSFTVVMDDGSELDAKLVGTDERTDLAVLKVEESRKFTYVAFADDAKVRVGDWVVAVGNPFGLGGTVTAGIVSARGRDIGAGPYDDFLQIDAAVNRGNSGGPAFNLTGEVVGINTAIFSPSGGNVGIAFAIPASTAREVVADLIADGSVSRGWLGVQIQPVTPDLAESLGIAGTKGVLVSEPQPDSPALKAGMKSGDVIVSVDEKQVSNPKELARLIGTYAPGKTAQVQILRDGKSQTLAVALGTMPGTQQAAAVETPATPDSDDALADFGLTVTPAEDGKGILVTAVEPGSDAGEQGIQAGDIIRAVNSRAVTDAKGVSEAVAEASKAGRKAVLVQVSRDDASRFVALPVAEG